MNRFIEFIKRIFFKKRLALNEAKNPTDEKYSNQKEIFLHNIKVENGEDSILLVQMKLENGSIDENKLSAEQVVKIKDLYCNQISDLIDSIKKHKLKLNDI